MTSYFEDSTELKYQEITELPSAVKLACQYFNEIFNYIFYAEYPAKNSDIDCFVTDMDVQKAVKEMYKVYTDIKNAVRPLYDAFHIAVSIICGSTEEKKANQYINKQTFTSKPAQTRVNVMSIDEFKNSKSKLKYPLFTKEENEYIKQFNNKNIKYEQTNIDFNISALLPPLIMTLFNITPNSVDCSAENSEVFKSNSLTFDGSTKNFEKCRDKIINLYWLIINIITSVMEEIAELIQNQPLYFNPQSKTSVTGGKTTENAASAFRLEYLLSDNYIANFYQDEWILNNIRQNLQAGKDAVALTANVPLASVPSGAISNACINVNTARNFTVGDINIQTKAGDTREIADDLTRNIQMAFNGLDTGVLA